MCIVCVLIDKQKITRSEAKKALWEQVITDTLDDDASEQKTKHAQEVYAKLEREEREEANAKIQTDST